MLEALSREIRSGYPEELLYTYDLAVVIKTLESMKETGSLERRIGVKSVDSKCKEDKSDYWGLKYWKGYNSKQVSGSCVKKGYW